VRQAVPLKPIKVQGKADIPLEDPTPVQVDVPKGGCDHTGAGLLAGPVTPRGTHAGAACS